MSFLKKKITVGQAILWWAGITTGLWVVGYAIKRNSSIRGADVQPVLPPAPPPAPTMPPVQSSMVSRHRLGSGE